MLGTIRYNIVSVSDLTIVFLRQLYEILCKDVIYFVNHRLNVFKNNVGSAFQNIKLLIEGTLKTF